MKLLDYSVPTGLSVPTTVENGKVVSILQPASFDRLILGVGAFVQGQITLADYINAVSDPWGFTYSNVELYWETIDMSKLLWSNHDLFQNNGIYYFLQTVYVRPNTRIILNYGNLKPSAATQLLSIFFIARTKVYR
jgi:hypothetical protein